MNKTKIEWADYTINSVKGLCPMACSYCYARAMYKRFKWNPEITFNENILYDFDSYDYQPSKIFVGSTMELFGDWIKPEWLENIFEWVRANPQHTFIFLTKQPHNLIKWSPFPENAWVGVSTTGFDCRSGLEDIFYDIQAKVKFVSIEPLLDYSPMDFRWVDWVIVGQKTPINKKTMPRIEWIKDIIESCDSENKPVFLKDNLFSLFNTYNNSWAYTLKDGIYSLRQEFPNIKGGSNGIKAYTE